MNKLVDVKWLASHEKDPDLIIIDASPTEEYISMHIKNAVSASFPPDVYLSHGMNTSYGGGVDLFTDPESAIPFRDGPPEYIGEIVRSLGVNNNSRVVVYDNGGTFLATRMYWTLTHHGKKDVFILDGGMESYLMEDLEPSSETVTLPKGNFEPRLTDLDTVVDTEYVLSNLTNPNVTIVDANLQSWFHGGYLAYSKGGHIPFALNVPYDSYFRKDKTWKSKQELREMFEALGISPNSEIIVYCGGNPAGSSLYFTVKHVLGYPRVKFYFGALITWLSDQRNLPVFTYGNDNMLRDPEWVLWFAGPRIQSLVRDTKVRVVDVRSSEEYEAGHIPFSLNIPIKEFFFTTKRDWSSLEDFFGAIGIGPEMEVVIYDGQSNLNSSLLLWLLEGLGHEKISFLNGGFKAWQDRGFEVSREQTPIHLPVHKFDVAISPTLFKTQNSKKNYLLEKDLPSEEAELALWLGLFSENQNRFPSSAAKDFKSIRCKDAISENGLLRSAGDLSSLFEYTGISKDQQIICHYDWFEESTFLYTLLKLMGFKNMKVFVPENVLNDSILKKISLRQKR